MKVEADDRPPAGSTTEGFAEPPQRRSAWARKIDVGALIFRSDGMPVATVRDGDQIAKPTGKEGTK
jgi:hypothetical protein